MKKYMTILGLLMLLNPCKGQTGTMATKTMLEEFNLKGKVKTLTYEHKKGNHKLYFDENGRLIKQENVSSYYKYTEIHNNYVYEKGKLQSFDVCRIFPESPTPSFYGKVVFEYKGFLIRSDSYNNDNKTIYKYDKKGNRIERYSEYLKTRQKFNAKGQVIDEWNFHDKETKVKYLNATDSQGNPLPEEIHTIKPHESPPNKYEHNEFGDVISIASKTNSPPDTITLVYDNTGNWIERTAHGSSAFYPYLTTEEIYTRKNYYGQQYIRRVIEYYENETGDSNKSDMVNNVEITISGKSEQNLLEGTVPVSLVITNKTNHNIFVALAYPNPSELSFESQSPIIKKKNNENEFIDVKAPIEEISPGEKYEVIYFLNRYFIFTGVGKAEVSYRIYPTIQIEGFNPENTLYEGTFSIEFINASNEELINQFSVYSTQLKSDNRKIKMESAEALSFIDNPVCIDYITPMLFIENLEIVGINTLCRFKTDKVKELISGMLSHKESAVVSATITALHLKDVEIPRFKFIDMLSSENASIRFIGLENLELYPDINDKQYLKPLLNDLNPVVLEKATKYNTFLDSLDKK
jgi:hypothetical protein